MSVSARGGCGKGWGRRQCNSDPRGKTFQRPVAALHTPRKDEKLSDKDYGDPECPKGEYSHIELARETGLTRQPARPATRRPTNHELEHTSAWRILAPRTLCRGYKGAKSKYESSDRGQVSRGFRADFFSSSCVHGSCTVS
jgi:hypothetical protein